MYLILTGSGSILWINVSSAKWAWKLFAGIVSLVTGIIILSNPLWSSNVPRTTLIGISGGASVIIGAIYRFQVSRGTGWVVTFLSSTEIVIGLLLLSNALTFDYSIPWVIGLIALVGGMVVVFGSYRYRSDELLSAKSKRMTSD